MCSLAKKGFNIRENESGVELNLHVEQFIDYIKELPKTQKGWVSLQIYKLPEPTDKGYTHNLYQVIRKASKQD